ncbi:hypothetical protein D3C81_2103610 [compost metagenome]
MPGPATSDASSNGFSQTEAVLKLRYLRQLAAQIQRTRMGQLLCRSALEERAHPVCGYGALFIVGQKLAEILNEYGNEVQIIHE